MGSHVYAWGIQMINKIELSPCCNERIVGILLGAKQAEQKMCTKCGKLLGVKEERLPYTKYITKREREEGFSAYINK